MSFSKLLLFASLGTMLVSAAAQAAEPRTVFVQLFEWPWKSVAEECERYLGPSGFSAVQVSPPTEHVSLGNHPWWERYQPVSHRLESRSGSEQEFVEMVRRCKAAGVDVYADVVLNHMTSTKEKNVGFAGSPYGRYEYPGLFGYNDFHHCRGTEDSGIKDYSSIWEIQTCELLGLHDIDTGNASVQNKLADLMKRLLKMGVAGFRVDASKHMAAHEIGEILGKVPGNFYVVHELITGPGEPVAVEPYLPSGDVNVFPYAYGIGMAVRGGDLTSLLQLPSKFGVPSDKAVTFLENHDLERRPLDEPLALFVADKEQHQLARAFLLTFPYGYPQIYSGFYFNGDYDKGPAVDQRGLTLPVLDRSGNCVAPWTCAHREHGVRELVQFRNHTANEFYASDVFQPKRSILAYGRGSKGHVILNGGNSWETVKTKTRLQPGRYCSLLDSNFCGNVDDQGMLEVLVGPRGFFVTRDDSRR